MKKMMSDKSKIREVSEIQGFDFNISANTQKTQKTDLDILEEAKRYPKDKAVKEEVVITEEKIADSKGRFQIIGVNFTEDFNKFLSENKLNDKNKLGSDLAHNLLKTERAKAKGCKSLFGCYPMVDEIRKKGFDAYTIKWLEREDWKTEKLIAPVKIKASGMIRKRFTRSLGAHDLVNRITSTLDYLLCMEDPEVFAAYYKLTRSNMLRGLFTKTGDRRARVFGLGYRYSMGEKFKTELAVDSNGEGVCKNASTLLYNIFKDARKLKLYASRQNNVFKYITQKSLRDDYQAVEAYYNSQIKLDEVCNFNIPFIRERDVLVRKSDTYREYLGGLEEGFMDFIKAKQVYLQQGLLAMACDYSHYDACKGYELPMLIPGKGGSVINPLNKPITGTHFTEPALDAMIYCLSYKTSLTPEQVAQEVQFSLTKLTEIINEIQTNNIKMHTKNLIYTERVVDEDGKEHFVTKTIPHAKGSLFELDGLEKLKSVLVALNK